MKLRRSASEEISVSSSLKYAAAVRVLSYGFSANAIDTGKETKKPGEKTKKTDRENIENE